MVLSRGLLIIVGGFINMHRIRNVSFVIKCVVGLTCVFLLSTILGCSFFEGKTFTYHRPARVHCFNNNFFQDNNDNIYFIKNSQLYKQASSDSFLKYDYPYWKEKQLDPHCCSLNNSHLFFYLSMHGEKSNNDRIIMINKNFDVELELPVVHSVRAMLEHNGFLYCFSEYYAENDYHSILEKYNLTTKENVVLDTEFKLYDHYVDDSIELYLKENWGSFELLNIADGLFNASFSALDCYHSDFGNIKAEIKSEELIISFLNNSFSFLLPYNSTCFCENVYLVDDRLIFGLREYIDINDCVPRNGYNCICHYGRSSLIEFDLSLLVFKTINEYPKGTILIDYDAGGTYYYLNGSLYFQDEFFKKCQTIVNRGTITYKGDYPKYLEDNWHLGHFRDEMYCFLL